MRIPRRACKFLAANFWRAQKASQRVGFYFVGGMVIFFASCSTRQPAPVHEAQAVSAFEREQLAEASRYVYTLAEQGLLPGVRTGDWGKLWVTDEGLWRGGKPRSRMEAAFPITLTAFAYLSNVVTSVTNAYVITKESETNGWHLDGAWRWGHGKYVELPLQTATQSDERLWVEATINRRPVQLAIDTGVSGMVLFPKAAARLGLSIRKAAEDAGVDLEHIVEGTAEECEIRLFRTNFTMNLPVLKVPAQLNSDLDGLVGWSQLGSGILRIDACLGTVTWLANLPPDITNWTRLEIDTNSSVLRLEAAGWQPSPFIIPVDTGSPHGVTLCTNLWQEWRASHSKEPMTLSAFFMPLAGLEIAQEAWANSLAVGPLMLKSVPVESPTKGDATFGGTGWQATLGLAALKRLEIVLDCERSIAYLRGRETPAAPYEHNRLGAEFVPVDFQSDELIAHVVEGSPAWDAGVRNGDVLLRVGKSDVTKWRTNPELLGFNSRPAGTKLKLTLRRGKTMFKAHVVLREILSDN